MPILSCLAFIRECHAKKAGHSDLQPYFLVNYNSDKVTSQTDRCMRWFKITSAPSEDSDQPLHLLIRVFPVRLYALDPLLPTMLCEDCECTGRSVFAGSICILVGNAVSWLIYEPWLIYHGSIVYNRPRRGFF